MYRQLYLFVEGSRDETFVEGVIKPRLMPNYDYIKCITYAQKSKFYITRFIYSLTRQGADIWYLTDMNTSPCVSEKKTSICNKKFGEVDLSNIHVVKAEIESWYCAGVEDVLCQRLKMRIPFNTEGMCKEHFQTIVSKSKCRSETECLMEILDQYNMDLAKRRNQTFDRFCGKYSII